MVKAQVNALGPPTLLHLMCDAFLQFQGRLGQSLEPIIMIGLRQPIHHRGYRGRGAGWIMRLGMRLRCEIVGCKSRQGSGTGGSIIRDRVDNSSRIIGSQRQTRSGVGPHGDARGGGRC